MKISQTLYAKKIKLERLKKNLPIFDAGLGENPLPMPPILKKVLIENIEEKEYTDAKGIIPLQKILGNKLLIGNGLKPLLFNIQLAFSKLYPEGLIFHIVPYWVSYSEQTKLLNLKTQNIIPKDKINWKITANDLENVLSNHNGPNLILFNNPTNPTGCYYTKHEIQELAKIFKKYNSIVVADDIYEKIIHLDHQEKFGQIRDYYDLTISGSSLSKMMALGGYRFGWFIFNSEKLNDLYNLSQIIASSTYSCPSKIFQFVAVKALEEGKEITNFLTFQASIFTNISKYIRKELDKTKITYSDSNGAWYILLNFDNYKNKLESLNIKCSNDLANYLINTFGIITVSGSAFGIMENLVLRFSYVDIKNIDIDNQSFDYQNIKKLFEILINWLNNL